MATKEKRKPTIKQKRAVEILVGNGGNVTQAMLEAGYTVATANTPQKLTESQAYKDMVLEDEFINAGLTKTTLAQNVTRIAFTAKKQNQFTGEVDSDDGMQIKAMEFAAKLVGWQSPPRAPVDEEGKTVTPIYTLGAE